MATITNLYVDAGTTYNVIITCVDSAGTPLNLTGFTVASQIRKSYGSLTAYSFNPTIFSTTGGKIKLTLSATQSGAIKPGRYLYDVEITNGAGEKQRVAEGIVIITPEITKV